jgi:hypothetical protein
MEDFMLDLYYPGCPKCKRYQPQIPVHQRSALPGLLLVCRQITDEVETMLYGGNTFKVSLRDGDQESLAALSPRHRAMMKKMVVVLRTSDRIPRPLLRMDPGIWDNLLPNLSTLEIVAQEPWEKYIWALEEWKASLTQIFEYLARAVPSDTRIVVDARRRRAGCSRRSAFSPSPPCGPPAMT